MAYNGQMKRDATLKSGKNRSLEALRGIAAVSVVVHHLIVSWNEVDGGLLEAGIFMQNGLNLFFAISGFLLFRPFLYVVSSEKPEIKIKRFMLNRILRIYPTFLVVFLVCQILSLNRVKVFNDLSFEVGTVTDPVTIVMNLSLLQTLFPATAMTGIGPSWSLTVELCFYLFLALVSMLVPIGKKWVALGLTLALGAFSVMTLALAKFLLANAELSGSPPTEWGNSITTVILRSFPALGVFFACGMLAAWLTVNYRNSAILKIFRFRLIAFLVAALFMVSALFLHNNLPTQILFGVLSTLILTKLWVLPQGSRLSKILASPILQFLGKVSFGIYLIHMPLIYWFREASWLTSEFWSWQSVFEIALYFSSLLILGYLAHAAVERPTMSLMKPWHSRKSTS
jgi:peptidoglycan/LPS O-acetylase OafA/YrhL